jgi:outer membrane protein assembly factor BamB
MSFLKYAGKRALAFSGLFLMLAVMAAGCAPNPPAGGGSAPAISGGTIYIVSQRGELMAMKPETGERTWSADLQQPAQRNLFGCAAAPSPAAVYGTPAVAGELVYVGGYDGRLRVYNNGLEQARYPAEGATPVGGIVGSPVLGRGNIYFGTSRGEVFALEAATLARKWQAGIAGSGEVVALDVTSARGWQSDGRSRVWATPVLADDTIYVASMNGRLYALNADTGAEKWRFATGGAVTSPPVITGDTAYFGSFDRYFYAVNTSTGQQVWKSSIQAVRWFWSPPLIAGGAVYAGAMDGKVYVFDAATGVNLATRDLGAPLVVAPVLSGDSVLFVTETGRLWALDAASYQARELQAAITGKVHAPLTLDDTVLYIHTREPDSLYVVRATTGVNILSIPLSSR